MSGVFGAVAHMSVNVPPLSIAILMPSTKGPGCIEPMIDFGLKGTVTLDGIELSGGKGRVHP